MREALALLLSNQLPQLFPHLRHRVGQLAGIRIGAEREISLVGAGFLAKHRMIRSASAGGTAVRASVTGFGASVTCAARTDCAVPPMNGGRPATISYASTPKA